MDGETHWCSSSPILWRLCCSYSSSACSCLLLYLSLLLLPLLLLILHQFHSLTPLRLEEMQPGDLWSSSAHRRPMQELSVSDAPQMNHPGATAGAQQQQAHTHIHTLKEHHLSAVCEDLSRPPLLLLMFLCSSSGGEVAEQLVR